MIADRIGQIRSFDLNLVFSDVVACQSRGIRALSLQVIPVLRTSI